MKQPVSSTMEFRFCIYRILDLTGLLCAHGVLRALQRYRAAIILIHGLCQHATTEQDKSLLAECLRMVQNRHATLFTYVTSVGLVGAVVCGQEGGASEPFRQQPPMPSENPTAVGCVSR
ncbi:hypothetical protein ACTXT7_006064 [Hymenolepis weldensis]